MLPSPRNQRRRARALVVAVLGVALTAPVAVDLTTTPVAAATGCQPFASQVSLFVNRSYGSTCVTFNVGSFPRVAALGFPDNTASSIKVGGNVVAVVHQDLDFGGNDNHSWQTIAASDTNLGDNLFPNLQSPPEKSGRIEDAVSGLWVMRKACAPGAAQVAVFRSTSGGGACALVGAGTFPSAVQAGIPANFVGSLKVGSSTRVGVWAGTSFNGASCTYNAGAAANPICIGASQLSAIVVANDSAAPSLSVSHAADGPGGWNIASPVTLAIGASDTGTGLLRAPTCKDNGSALTVGGSAPAFSANVTGGGTHVVACTARDHLGNTVNVSDTVRIDIAAPSLTVTGTSRGAPYTPGTWVNDDVTVSFACTDAHSGVASVNPPVTVSAEGAGQGVAGTCADNAGNTTTRSLDPIKIDKTPPVIAGSRAPQPPPSGWFATDVVVSFDCDDALSGVASVTQPRTISADGGDQAVTGTCADRAGNQATATIGDIDIDQDPPVITPTATAAGRPYQSGTWSKDDVTVTFGCVDHGSGVASVSSPAIVGSEGTGQSVTGTCTDNLGSTTTRTFDDIRIDKTAPTISASATAGGATYVAGTWTAEDVKVTFACDDARSGVASVSAPVTVTTEGPLQSATGTCTDRAGNTATAASTGISIDKRVPALSASATSAGAAYQSGAWTKANVVVTFTCSDHGSGVASLTPPVTVAAEGVTPSVSGTCTDHLGKSTTRTFDDVRIDKTPPSIGFTGNTGTYEFGTPIPITCSASDAVSGLAANTCADLPGPSEELGLGTHTLSAFASDRAGNTATAATTFVVEPRGVASVASGAWSDPAVWSSGAVPSANDKVTVRGAHTVTLDVATAVASGIAIEPNAALVFAPGLGITLTTTRNVVVEGRLVMRPVSSAVLHVVRFVGIDERSYVGGGMTVRDSDVGLWVVGSGVIDAVGTAKAGWTRVSAPVPAGATSITLERPPVGWEIGDEIVIAPTESPSVGNASWQGFEERSITGVAGATVTFAPAASRAHPVVNGSWGAEVMNLTRNVRIEGTPSGRAHVMFLASVPQTLSNVAVRHTGPRQDRDGDGITSLVLGRYPLHFHMQDDGSRGSLVESVVVRDAGSHSFVAHTSHGITFRDTIAYNVFDDAYWWDEEELTDDTRFEHAIAALVKSDPTFRGYKLNGFTLGRGTGNVVRDSVAVGVQGNVDSSGFQWPEEANLEPNTWEFADNVAHNNKVDGIFTWQNTKGPHVVGPFVAYHNGGFGIDHGAYVNPYHYVDADLFWNKAGGISQEALSRGAAGQLTFERMRVVGGPSAVEIGDHSLPGVLPTAYRDCDFREQTGPKVVVRERGEAGWYDFIDCALEPADFSIVSTVPGMIIRVQRPDQTAFQIDAAGTVTTIPPFESPAGG
jgi:hypothetical protein